MLGSGLGCGLSPSKRSPPSHGQVCGWPAPCAEILRVQLIGEHVKHVGVMGSGNHPGWPLVAGRMKLRHLARGG